MKNNMTRFGLSLAPVLLLAASSHAAPRSVYFWNSAAGTEAGRAGVDSARVGVWGNGEFADARDVRYEGANTLKITTRNFREGVRFDLKTPLDIAPYRETGYIRLRVRFREVAPVAGTPGAMEPGGPGMRPPGMPAPGMGTPGFGGAAPGGFGGFGGARFEPNFQPKNQAHAQLGPLPPLGAMGGLPGMGEGGVPVPTGPLAQETPITQLLCTLVLENGVIEGTVDVPKSWETPRQLDFDKVRPDAGGWLLLALPLKQMRSTPGASGALQRVILSGNRQDSFWLTQAALVVETGAMQVSIRKLTDKPGTQTAEITVRPGPISLVADVEAGAADPAIEWNFDADNVGNLPPANPDGLAPGQPLGGEIPGLVPGGLPGQMPGAAPGEGAVVPVGPRIDARGLVAKFEYPNEEQNYRVEVTVRDRTGKKEPVTSSIIVSVRG